MQINKLMNEISSQNKAIFTKTEKIMSIDNTSVRILTINRDALFALVPSEYDYAFCEVRGEIH